MSSDPANDDASFRKNRNRLGSLGEFYELLARKLKMQFGGLVTFPNLSGHSWLQHEAPRQLDADCIWILGSGRAICKPAYEIVVRSKREQLFGINLNQALEDYADYLYR